MCVCASACTYLIFFAYDCMCIYVCVYVYMYICVCMYARVRANLFVCLPMCMCICVCVRGCVVVRVYGGRWRLGYVTNSGHVKEIHYLSQY